jgi:hypothetical protein
MSGESSARAAEVAGTGGRGELSKSAIFIEKWMTQEIHRHDFFTPTGLKYREETPIECMAILRRTTD